MTKTQKKFMALAAAAALGTAGIAWAAVTGGLITDAVSTVPTDLTYSAANVNSLGAFNTDAATVTLAGNVILPVDTGFGISYDIISNDGNSITTYTAPGGALPHYTSGDISVPEGKFFVIKPATSNLISVAAGFLRLSGKGTTSVWAANGDAPTSGIYNTFAAGTYLHEGTLVVTHNNSLGEGHVKLRGDSTLRSQATVALGEKTMAGASLLNNQHVLLRPVSIDSTGLADLTDKSMSNVTFDVIENAKLAVHSRISADLRAPTAVNPLVLIPADRGRIGIVKTGVGPMDIFAEFGARHTDGTHVKAGSLSSIPTGNIRYVGPIGFQYMGTPNSAKGVWRGVVTANYADTYRNTMNIEKDAFVTVNRDQIFGDFKGTGTFNTNEYTVAEGGSNKNVFPTIVFRANNRDRFATAIENESSLFDGLLNGNMDIVVDAPIASRDLNGIAITQNAASNKGGQVVYLANENNNIPKGDTAIVQGVLAVKGTKSIGPGTIYLGIRNKDDGTTTAGARDTKGTNNSFFYGEKGAGTMAVPTLMGSGSVAFPVTQLVRIDTNLDTDAGGVRPGNLTTAVAPELASHLAGANTGVANLAAVRNTTLSIASLDIVNLPLTINHDFAALADSESMVPRYSSGTVKVADQYIIRGVARHQVAVERGVLHLEKLPITSATDAGYMNVGISSGAALSLGGDARDFSKLMDFVVAQDDSRIRVVVKPTDVAATENDALASTAIFRADNGDFRNLGTGENNKDNRLVIQLDLTQVNDVVKAGSWIKVMSLRDTQGWNALHYLREASAGAPEDYIKIDLATPEDVSYSRAGKVEAILSQNGYDVLVKVTQNLSPIERKGHINLTATGGVSTVTANVAATDVDGKAVASADVTITVAGKTETAMTDTDGKATVTFSGVAAGTHDVVAKIDGFADETKTVTVGGGSSSSSSGCDAGLGLGSLLLVAGGAVALRKKKD